MSLLLVTSLYFWAAFKVGIVLVSAFKVKIRVIYIRIIQLSQYNCSTDLGYCQSLRGALQDVKS